MKLNELLKQAEIKKNFEPTKLKWTDDFFGSVEKTNEVIDFYLKTEKDLKKEALIDAFRLVLLYSKRQMKDISALEFYYMYEICSGTKTFEDILKTPNLWDVKDTSLVPSIYRTSQTFIFDTDTKASDAQEISHFMEHFLSQMNYSKNWMHEIEFAAMSHKRIIDIQPFEKYNEVMSFLFLNRLLVTCGYPMISLLGDTYENYKSAYFKTRTMTNPDIDSFTKIIAKAVLER